MSLEKPTVGIRDTSLPPVVIESSIQTVTLHPDQATVIRQGHVFLEVGPAQISFTALPATLKPNSVRLVAANREHIQLRDVLVQANLPANPNAEATRTTTSEIQALEEAYYQAKDDLARLQLQKEFLQGLFQRSPHTYALGLAQNHIALEDAQAMLTFLGDQQRQVLTAIAQAEKHRHQVDQQLQAARGRLNKLKDYTPDLTYTVTTLLDVLAIGTYTFDLVYTVSGAGWTPEYTARLDTQSATIRLTRLAQVHQHSGEDWPDVALVLSTAQPSTESAPPPPPSWTLRLPSRVKGGRRSQQNPQALEDAYRMIGAIPGSEMPALDPENGRTARSVIEPLLSLDSEGNHTIPHQEHPCTVEIDQHQYSCDLIHVTYLQNLLHPYIKACLVHPDCQSDLLAGPLKLFRDGSYVGNTQLPQVMPNEPFVLYFGTTDQITLQRNLTTREAVTGETRQDILGYRIVLRNGSDIPQKCVVIETLPFSQDETIQVRLTQATPPVTPDSQGHCEWQIMLSPRATETIEYQFVIEGPRDQPILGLDS
jgi:uncharacterized protein (TIGR02231 family)